MTEIELFQLIYEELINITRGLSLFFWCFFMFELIKWMRRIITKWKRGQGVNE